jgi:hypothetical protein
MTESLESSFQTGVPRHDGLANQPVVCLQSITKCTILTIVNHRNDWYFHLILATGRKHTFYSMAPWIIAASLARVLATWDYTSSLEFSEASTASARPVEDTFTGAITVSRGMVRLDAFSTFAGCVTLRKNLASSAAVAVTISLEARSLGQLRRQRRLINTTTRIQTKIVSPSNTAKGMKASLYFEKSRIFTNKLALTSIHRALSQLIFCPCWFGSND